MKFKTTDFIALKMNETVLFSCLQQLGNNPVMAAQVHSSPLKSQQGQEQQFILWMQGFT